jgi:hypothetical protein
VHSSRLPGLTPVSCECVSVRFLSSLCAETEEQRLSWMNAIDSQMVIFNSTIDGIVENV